MPNPAVDKLSKASSDASAKAAVSACIAEEVHRGHDQQQAIAMCYSMVENKIGRKIGGK